MVFVSCENSPNDKVTEKTEDLTGQFSLSINNKVSESIFANSRGIESSRKLVVEKYRITGSGPNGELLEEKTIQATASSSVSYKSLSVGEWLIKVEALNEEGAIVGEGSKSIKIEKGKEITEAIDVYECEGEGTLHVNIEYDNNTDSYIELIVSNAAKNEVYRSTLSRTGKTYSIAFPLSNGFYRLDMKVDGGEKIFLETVRIVKGATTSFSATYETKNGNIISNIVTHIVTTPEITLTLESESVAQNGILNAKAIVSGIENASYNWYIDGSLINGATETSLSYGDLSSLALSNHRLTFVVSNGEVIWSKDANFEVKEAFYIDDFTINAKSEYIYTDTLDVTLSNSKSFDDTYSIKWYLDNKEIIPSDINLSDYLGNYRLMAVVEKNGVSKSTYTYINIKAVASNLKIDSAYAGLAIKGSISIQPESVKNRSIGIMFEKIDDNSSSYCTSVYVDENGNFSGSMPDIIKAGKYKAYIQDSAVKCDDIVEVEVLAQPTFTISGPTTIKQYSTAVFELLPDPSLSYINWEIDGKYVYSNYTNEKNKFVLKYDIYSPSNYPAVGEHKLTAKNGNNELASVSFTVEALDEMDSIIIEALPAHYYSTDNITSATGNAHMKIKFDNTQATLADGCIYIANTYNEDYVIYDATATYSSAGYSVEVKGGVDITYNSTESHYLIGSLKFDFMPPSGESSSVTVSNVRAENVFKDGVDISTNEDEINRLASFAMGLMGTKEGVTFVEYETTAKQKWEYTNYKNNENSEYIVNGSVIGEQNRTDLNSESYIYSSSFTFEKESETHTFSYDISYKSETIETENGKSNRYYDTNINNVMFDGKTIELNNLADATISRMKDFVGDREL